MSLYAAAGIYLVLDVNTPLLYQHLNKAEPWTTYHDKYLTHVFSAIEAFMRFPNLLAFLAGNEVIYEEDGRMHAPPYLKAVVRDMKAYISQHAPRTIPVGYAAADYLEARAEIAAYLQCGPAPETADYLGINTYQWCGQQTMQSSGYDKLVKTYENMSIPVIFTEFGCNKVLPRVFQEISAIFGDQMTHVFSGGLVYQYHQDANNMGLVKINSDQSITLLPDYDAVKKQYSAVKLPTSFPDRPSVVRPTVCPAASTYKYIKGDPELPACPAASLLKDGVKPEGNYSPGKLVTPSIWSTTHKIVDSSGKEILDKTIQKGTFDPDKYNDQVAKAGKGIDQIPAQYRH